MDASLASNLPRNPPTCPPALPAPHAHLLRQHGLLALHQRHVAHQARVLLAQARHLDLVGEGVGGGGD